MRFLPESGHRFLAVNQSNSYNWRLRCMEAYMRAIAIISIATLATLSLSGSAVRAEYEGGPWCAYYGSGSGGTNCGFHSFEQCQAAISGNGGKCLRNQWYSGGGKDSRRR